MINAESHHHFYCAETRLLAGKARDDTGQLHFDSLGLGRWLRRSGDENSANSAKQLLPLAKTASPDLA
ncbi:hypothetical protein ACNKHL_26120 [Shigella flexneri]